MTIDRDREQILRIAAQHGARNVRVFGSVARGDDRADSDVDLLVEMEDNRSPGCPDRRQHPSRPSRADHC